MVIWTTLAALAFAACLCIVKLGPENAETAQQQQHHPRLATCRTTCDARLQSAALESHVPPSLLLTPAAFDSLFLQREEAEDDGAERRRRHPGLQGGGSGGAAATGRPSEADGGYSQQPAHQARPRRLPALIKTLTGFGDETNAPGGEGGKSVIIARIERPRFASRVPQRRGTGEPTSHEETVQIAAAAAAAAVFSRSMRIFGNNRMHRVNSEWDAALRWIAGWDRQRELDQQRPLQMPSSPGGRGGPEEPPIRDGGGGTPSNVDAGREGFDDFVDDLARMLEECISQCVEDESFEARLKEDGAGQSDISFGSLSIGNLILRSLFGWFFGSSFSEMLSRGKLGLVSSQGRLIVARALQVVASSVAVFVLHSLWSWAAPALNHWYSSLGYTESPEWLLEHEEEIKLAKSSKSRQKKKAKRKQSHRQPGSRSKSMPDGVQKQGPDQEISTSILEPDPSANRSGKAPGMDVARNGPSIVASAEKWQCAHRSEHAEPSFKDSASDSQDSITTEGIPSIISYPTTSASSSPSLKPIGSHLEDRVVAPPQQVLRMTPPLGGPVFPQLANRQALPVPTQKQREEAANQLREYQNAQIQRLLLRRQLSQFSSFSQLSDATAPKGSGLISDVRVPRGPVLNPDSSFHSIEKSTATLSYGQRSKVMRPPPGLVHPSQVSHNPIQPNQDDNAFLNDNELFLSKLLDDEDDDEVISPSPPPIGIESMSPELSLDPSAAPFVSSGNVGAAQTVAVATTASFPSRNDEKKGDIWQSSPSDLLLKEDSPVRIKGVYGGSVW